MSTFTLDEVEALDVTEEEKGLVDRLSTEAEPMTTVNMTAQSTVPIDGTGEKECTCVVNDDQGPVGVVCCSNSKAAVLQANASYVAPQEKPQRLEARLMGKGEFRGETLRSGEAVENDASTSASSSTLASASSSASSSSPQAAAAASPVPVTRDPSTSPWVAAGQGPAQGQHHAKEAPAPAVYTPASALDKNHPINLRLTKVLLNISRRRRLMRKISAVSNRVFELQQNVERLSTHPELRSVQPAFEDYANGLQERYNQLSNRHTAQLIRVAELGREVLHLDRGVPYEPPMYARQRPMWKFAK